MYGHETETVQRINESNVDEAFQYQPWNEEQVKAGEGEIFLDLDAYERERMRRQLEYMEGYLNMLNERIVNFQP